MPLSEQDSKRIRAERDTARIANARSEALRRPLLKSQLLPSGGVTRNMAQAYLWHFKATQKGTLAETTERLRRIFDHSSIEVWAHPAETPTVPDDLKCRPGDGH